ncbi:hypothetical protein Daesc_000254 [Daldinia eschscholtzii]|uniref:FAD-binding PCMH-type domain-containing protein n=1 Tax=Daldinia eschscholtzii TaxID=292717 RepID=A0AAX6MXU8_9PEZI
MLAMSSASTPTNWMSLILWSSAWFSVTYAATTAGLASRVDLKSVLTNQKWSADTTISFTGSPEFYNATERWTTFSAPTYRAAISPATEDDVVKIVKIAKSLKIPFLATGGRHGYTTTLGDLHDGLAIDLSHFKSIHVDKSAQTVTVGPGVRVGEIFDPLYNAGFDILSVKIVTAKGDLIEASKNSHSDLFWAIRGAGANFGIIVSATYKVHPLTDSGNVFTVEYVVPAEKSSEYFKTIESMSPLPAELASIMLINSNSTTNKTQVQAQWTYKGREDKAREALSPILKLGLDATRMETVPWNKLIDSAFGNIMDAICAANITRDLYSWNMKNYSASTYDASFAKMDKYFADYPGARSSVLQFEFFPNQAMAAVPYDDTAFAWRDTTAYVNFNMLFDDNDITTRNASIALGLELRDDLVATSGYPEITVFVNYAHGDEKLEQIYGKDKLPRLAKLKKTWDPNHLFSFNNKLPHHYP